jgi:hypothetical protein
MTSQSNLSFSQANCRLAALSFGGDVRAHDFFAFDHATENPRDT